VVGVCVVRSGVNEHDSHYVDPTSASPLRSELLRGLVCLTLLPFPFSSLFLLAYVVVPC
jgi:hypothetical protein